MLSSEIESKVQDPLVSSITLYVVNDGSASSCLKFPHQWPIEIIHLQRNLGHQKALAMGLAYITQKKEADFIVVMDADGEDKPEDIATLLRRAIQVPHAVVFARRDKRQESWYFQGFYAIYKAIFKLLTGIHISFGNFSILPFALAKKLSFVSEIWNHYAGGAIKSKIPILSVPIHRGKRWKGESKMNFYSLVLHGLSAISVHIDVVAVRLLVVSILCILGAGIAMSVVIGIKLFTPLAIPGWTSFVVLGLAIVVMQAFLISMFLTFSILNLRTQKLFIPANDYEVFIEKIETWN